MAKGPYDDIVRKVLERLSANAPKAAAKARKAETRSQNQAAWSKRQDEMEARRMAGREKYNKKKKEGK